MNKRSAVQRLVGPLFVTGQSFTMFMSCKTCAAPLVSFRARVLGICAECLKSAGAEIGRILIVPPPSEHVREN